MSGDAAGAVAGAAAADARRFPCGGCGASVAWDAAAQGLRCPFCGASTDVRVEGSVGEHDLDAALATATAARGGPGGAAGPEGAPNVAAASRRAECASCGAVVEIPPTEKSGRCAYCGSARVLEDEPCPARIRPHAVLPFAIDAADARRRFEAWIRSLWFRPSALRTRAANIAMQGVLVPFWTYDADAESSWTALAGYHYWETVGHGKNRRTVRRTRWVPASGRRADHHDDVLVCASRGLDAALLDRIQPFPLAELVPYRDEYLAGWNAEAYALDVAAGWAAAQERVRAEQRSRCARDVPGDTHMGLVVDTRIRGLGYKHALLPVWIASYRFRDRAYRFLVNGRTGEVHGEAPLSWVKVVLLVLAILGALAAAAALLP